MTISWGTIKEYINLVGLVLDFFGFILLLREWWVAFLTQQRELELYQRRFRQEDMDRLQRQNANEILRNHLDTIKNMRERSETEAEIQDISTQLKNRRGLFQLSAFCIMVGFILQIVASIPSTLIGS
mmetsp:Transcript_21964/g.32445  ORF Transcript_21964/g.32445 Transcript_21964/m.32445 type:complete len:127 (+) Transcript_21964:21-401(+)|eukprot:CAMPEP_0194199686 /NCGR_PEP_ID=MMETSP0156-20130528/617_1 /TAXON_ID=33649 /ORGANISM="Thalassionema nitzschioides, Strain L26-B" /LENGTH=126 /DNA_ID=CAMNT_0038924621 /DNA_START=23 /DNA_END=400 /DNA_ORIENTATION=+